MRIDELLVHLLALATGIVLFIGLARALEGSPQRPRLRARIPRHVPFEDLHVPLSERRALASRSISVEPIRRLALDDRPERPTEQPGSPVEPGLRAELPAGGPLDPAARSTEQPAPPIEHAERLTERLKWLKPEPEPAARQAELAIERVELPTERTEPATEQPVRPAVPMEHVSDPAGGVAEQLELAALSEAAAPIEPVAEPPASATSTADPLALPPVTPAPTGLASPSLTPPEAMPIEEPAAAGAILLGPELPTEEAAMDAARAPGVDAESVDAELPVQTAQAEPEPAISKCQEMRARVATLMDRQQFGRALGLAKEGLARRDGSSADREVLGEMLWTSAAGEVGRLIGQALRGGGHVERGSERALARMDEAEAVVAAVPGSILTSARRQDLGRRLWWGYMKLGTGRLDAGDLDGALEPLFRAFRFGELDPERQTETRQLLARAVEGLVDQLGEASLERLREGDFNGALAESRRLSQVVDGGLERGLSQEDLASAIGRRHEILTQIAAG